jgi:hypothetical protein
MISGLYFPKVGAQNFSVLWQLWSGGHNLHWFFLSAVEVSRSSERRMGFQLHGTSILSGSANCITVVFYVALGANHQLAMGYFARMTESSYPCREDIDTGIYGLGKSNEGT